MERDDEDLGQEIELDAPEGEETEAPARRAEADDGADKEAELESYSKNVQNRIKKLTEKYRKEERDRQEAMQSAQKLQLDQAKLQQKAAGEAARLELQEEIADSRNAVNRERIAVQQDIAMANMRRGQ